MVPWVCLQFVIVVFLYHNHFLFFIDKAINAIFFFHRPALPVSLAQTSYLWSSFVLKTIKKDSIRINKQWKLNEI